MEDLIDKTFELNYLLDFYGNLLTHRQLDYLKKYYADNLSLSEIASIHDVSRTAIYDNIKRSTKLLYKYEDKLNLVEKFNQRQHLITQIEQMTNDQTINNLLSKLKSME